MSVLRLFASHKEVRSKRLERLIGNVRIFPIPDHYWQARYAILATHFVLGGPAHWCGLPSDCRASTVVVISCSFQEVHHDSVAVCRTPDQAKMERIKFAERLLREDIADKKASFATTNGTFEFGLFRISGGETLGVYIYRDTKRKIVIGEVNRFTESNGLKWFQQVLQRMLQRSIEQPLPSPKM